MPNEIERWVEKRVDEFDKEFGFDESLGCDTVQTTRVYTDVLKGLRVVLTKALLKGVEIGEGCVAKEYVNSVGLIKKGHNSCRSETLKRMEEVKEGILTAKE